MARSYNGQTCKLEDFNKVVQDTLQLYSREVTDGIMKAVDTVTKDAVKKLKVAGAFNGTTYKSGWKSKTVYKGLYEKRNVIYNSKQPQITHLLEYGHVKRNGRGLVRAFPHIMPVEQEMIEEFEKKVQEVI